MKKSKKIKNWQYAGAQKSPLQTFYNFIDKILKMIFQRSLTQSERNQIGQIYESADNTEDKASRITQLILKNNDRVAYIPSENMKKKIHASLQQFLQNPTTPEKKDDVICDKKWENFFKTLHHDYKIEINNRIEQTENKANSIIAELNNTLEKTENEANSIIAELKNTLGKNDELINTQDNTIKKLNFDIVNYQVDTDSLKECNLNIKKYKSNIEELNTTITNLNSDIEKLKAAANTQAELLANCTSIYNDHVKQIKEYENQIKIGTNQLQDAQINIENIKIQTQHQYNEFVHHKTSENAKIVQASLERETELNKKITALEYFLDNAKYALLQKENEAQQHQSRLHQLKDNTEKQLGKASQKIYEDQQHIINLQNKLKETENAIERADAQRQLDEAAAAQQRQLDEAAAAQRDAEAAAQRDAEAAAAQRDADAAAAAQRDADAAAAAQRDADAAAQRDAEAAAAAQRDADAAAQRNAVAAAQQQPQPRSKAVPAPPQQQQQQLQVDKSRTKKIGNILAENRNKAADKIKAVRNLYPAPEHNMPTDLALVPAGQPANSRQNLLVNQENAQNRKVDELVQQQVFPANQAADLPVAQIQPQVQPQFQPEVQPQKGQVDKSRTKKIGNKLAENKNKVADKIRALRNIPPAPEYNSNLKAPEGIIPSIPENMLLTTSSLKLHNIPRDLHQPQQNGTKKRAISSERNNNNNNNNKRNRNGNENDDGNDNNNDDGNDKLMSFQETCDCYNKKLKFHKISKKNSTYYEKCPNPVYLNSNKCKKHYMSPFSCYLKDGDNFFRENQQSILTRKNPHAIINGGRKKKTTKNKKNKLKKIKLKK